MTSNDGGRDCEAPALMQDNAPMSARAYEREEDLAAALPSLEAAAWRQLFEENYQRVFNYAHVRTGNAADADDIAANVFVEAVRGIHKFQYRGAPVAAWLFRIAHNETVDLLKRRARMPSTALDHPEVTARATTADAILASDQQRDISAALGRLKNEHRDVLMLRLIEGRSVRETAELLGKSEGAVKVLQMRALESLRKKMAG
jgi:RNA polymerase sigma-70 factor (ECF subfamily)